MGERGQLPLQFPFNDQQLLENFQPGVNAELLARLDRTPVATGFAGLWLWGEAGAGVTHLLNGACHRSGRAAYLPLAELPAQAEMLQGLDSCDLVALDDVEVWLGRRPLEAALLDLYQGMLTRGGTLICGASKPARGCDFALPDWRSRCLALLGYRVQPLDDVGKARLLQAHAAQRGLQIGEQVLKFWLARSERSVPGLLAELELLDAAALSAQRAITVPLVKAVLQL